MTAEQTGKAILVSKDSHDWLEAHWRYDFTISLPPISVQIPIFVPDSVPSEQRHEKAVESLRNITKAIAKKAEVTSL